MADFGFSFEIDSVEAAPSRDILPPGDYTAHIVDSEMRDTKSGTGKMLALTLEILDGPHAGRRLFDRLNIINQNPTAENIARQTLRAICAAIGIQSASNSEALHNHAMLVTVKVREAGNDKQGVYREAQNEVRGYKAAVRGRPAPQAFRPGAAPARPVAAPPRPAAPPARPTASTTGRPTPPWMAAKQAQAPAPEPQYEEPISGEEIPF